MRDYFELKVEIQDFVSGGGDLASLKKTDEIYKKVSNLRLSDVDGHRLTLEENFAQLGFERKSKSKIQPREKIKMILDDFVNNGGDVNNLKKLDEIYLKVKNARIYDDAGRLLTLEEKFAVSGYERKPKIDRNVKNTLVDEIDKYLANGGSFHVERKSLPFYAKLKTYSEKVSKERQKLVSHDDIMKELGYKNFSDLYFRLGDLKRMSEFRNEEGFVDSFRKDKLFSNYVDGCAKFLNMPNSLIPLLVCDEKLKNVVVDVNYFSYVKEQLEIYLKKYGKLQGLSSNDEGLYNKLKNIKTSIFAYLQTEVSFDSVLFMLGIDPKYKFSSSFRKPIDINNLMIDVQNKYKQKGSALTKADIKDDYIKLLTLSSRLGVSLNSFLKSYEVDYKGIEITEKFRKVFIAEFPYLQEMKVLRDNFMKNSDICKTKNQSKEQIFETWISACETAYMQYKPQIFDFDNETLSKTSKNAHKKVKRCCKFNEFQK